MKAKHGDAFQLKVYVESEALDKSLIPGTLNLMLERTFTENIISEFLPLKVNIKTKENRLAFGYCKNPLITETNRDPDRMHYISRAYAYFSDLGIEETNQDGNSLISIPLLEIEEE
jgi:hypothetical protein